MEKHQLLFESVFKNQAAPGGGSNFLEKIAEEYPYFSTAHFYLSQSLQGNPEAYKKQLKKTGVVFNNNYWLNFQLLEAERPDTTVNAQELLLAAEKQEPAAFMEESTNTTPEETASAESTINVSGTEYKEEASTVSETSLEETIHSINTAESPAEKETEIVLSTEIEPVVIAPEKRDKEIIETPINEPVELPVQENNTVINLPEYSAIIPVNTIPQTEEQMPEEKTVMASATQEANPIPSIKLSFDSLSTPVSDDAVLFEPLHTTDYFASVGIKLSDEIKSGDKLGKQLKSFTEWLKTMKKIHAEEQMKKSTAGEIEADNTESNIKQLAEQSNIEDEVVTEAMAEVLLQQGRNKKAIEVLEKLSLLNPTKSTFFAAKINQIKEA